MSIQDLINRAEAVRTTNVEDFNTAERIGGLMKDIVIQMDPDAMVQSAEAAAEIATAKADEALTSANDAIAAKDTALANNELLGGIAYNASAPTPGKSGKYSFTTGGSCTWLTGGAATVAVGDEVVVVYTAPSTYTYTKVGRPDIEEVRSQSTSKVPSSKLVDDELSVVENAIKHSNYYIAGIPGSMSIVGNTVVLSSFVFIYGKSRVTLQNGIYTLGVGHHALVSDDNGTITSVSYEIGNINFDKHYIVAYSDINGNIILNSNQYAKEAIDISIGNMSDSVYVEFTELGSYIENGTVNVGYDGWHKEIEIDKIGKYKVGWSLGGTVRKILAVDTNGNILKVWEKGYVESNFIIDVPVYATKLLATSYGDLPKNGYLTYIKEEKSDLLLPNLRIQGNPWYDGTLKNATSTNTFCEVYHINDHDEYDMYLWYPVEYSMIISGDKITSQPANDASLNPIVYNSKILNSIDESNLDVNVINGYSAVRQVITKFKFPAGSKSILLLKEDFGTQYQTMRIYKRSNEAKGIYKFNANANKSIVILGDSVSSNAQAEIGKEKLRDLLNCTFDTYGVGGAGFPISASPGWVTSRNVSGVYQCEELVKPATKTYDIYLLSGTLNDPITHGVDIGSYTDAKPYLRNQDNSPYLESHTLASMCGAYNFIIQRIYEKNPNAKIILSTANKCFLNEIRNGFGVEAGWNPLDATTNSWGHTYYDYVEAIRKLGEIWNLPVVDIYKKSGINNYNKTQMMIDEYHPTEDGYKRIYSNWFDAIINC